MDECIPHEEFSTNMKKFNDEQRFIVNDIIYLNIYILQNLYTNFLTRGVGIGKTFTLMCIIQNMLRYCIKDIPNVDPLKPKVMKLTYIGKAAFNNNGMTIHFTLVILLNKQINEFNAVSDEKRDSFINIYESTTFISHR